MDTVSLVSMGAQIIQKLATDDASVQEHDISEFFELAEASGARASGIVLEAYTKALSYVDSDRKDQVVYWTEKLADEHMSDSDVAIVKREIYRTESSIAEKKIESFTNIAMVFGGVALAGVAAVAAIIADNKTKPKPHKLWEK